MKQSENILSIDYEDWFTTSHYRHIVNDDNKKYLLDKPTHQILEILEKSSTQATFFVLGQVAIDRPELIEKIAQQGHEIASHGYSHTPLGRLSPQKFREEIITTNKILEDITQKKVIGFRAPFMSLNQQTSWAIDILKEEGFLYDSSIFPVQIPVYGVKNAPLYPYKINSENICDPSKESSLIEFPISIFQQGILKIPCSGGIYGRFLPYRLLSFLLHRIQKENIINFYLHPWELFNKRNLTPYPGLKNDFLANYQSKTYLQKIEKIIQEFRFSSFKDYLYSSSFDK